MWKQSTNSGTKEGIRSQSWFFSIAEKMEVISSATVEKSEWMTLVIWDFLGVGKVHDAIPERKEILPEEKSVVN